MKEVTGLEKDAKKLDNSGGKDVETITTTTTIKKDGEAATRKDGETNSESGKRKFREERPPTKVVVRRLPPSMTEEEFRQQIDPLPPIDYMYYVPADSTISNNPFCRAYLNFINITDVYIFSQKFDGYVFVDSKGMEYPALVEYAPFQRTPKQRTAKKKDPKAGTLESDPVYISFVEKLEAENEEKLAAINNMKQHFFETNVDSSEEKKLVTSTPLLEFLRARHLERLKAREEKRKKDLERKRARDEQRRNTVKKLEEDSSLVKPPVVSMSPKTEDERLMEQQTTLLRKLLGLPNPSKQVSQGSCNQVVEDFPSKSQIDYYNDSVLTFFDDGDESLNSISRDFNFSVADPLYSNGNIERRKYYVNNKGLNGIKLYPANGYWKRDVPHFSQGKRYNLWGGQNEVKNYSTKLKMNAGMTSFSDSKYKDRVMSKFEPNASKDKISEGKKCNNLEKELLDENALEAFPTFEESKLHKLQKSILKSQSVPTAPIRKQSVNEIKMKFQMWSHDVTTKSCSGRKKDVKKVDVSQVKVMKPSPNLKNGCSKFGHKNGDSSLQFLCEALLKDDVRSDKVKDNVVSNGSGRIIDYFTHGYKSFVKECAVNDIACQDDNNFTNCSSRFLISNNLKLPKAFGSGRKAMHKLGASSDRIPSLRNNLPKAFNSLLKGESQKQGCHQSHRNETINSSESSNNNPNSINRKSSPCSIIC